ncbi:MAG: GGDEF domain-containing protein, partial [Actinomycetota bacterium]
MKIDPIHKVGRAGSGRLPTFKIAVALVIAFIAFDVFWLQQRLGGPELTGEFSNLAGVATALIATAICARTWTQERGPRRRPWRILTFASATWAAGEIIWTFYEQVLHQPVPFPSAADVAFLAGYPLAGIAMLTFPTSPRQLSSKARTILDALVIGCSLLFLAWATFLGELYRGTTGTILEQTIGLAYPIADVVVAAIALFVVIRAQRGRRTTLLLLALGLLSLAIADSAFAYLTLIDRYSSGNATDAAWPLGYLLIALGALRHDPAAPRPERDDHGRAGVLFPYVAVLLVIAVAGGSKFRTGATQPVLFWGMLAIILLVVVRQLMTLVENLSLNRNLEHKVRERTAALARSEERHRSLVQHSSDVVTIVDREGVIVYASASTDRVLGFPPSTIIGRHLVDLAHPEERTVVEAYLTRFMQREGESPVMEWRLRHSDGTWHYCESVGTNLLEDASVEGFVLNTRDISDRKELEIQLRHQAFHDQLTGSPNRALFRDRADHALRRAARNRKPIAVLYCDLDNLKEVNDRLGHGVGDML